MNRKHPGRKLRLSQAAWDRVLSEARRLAAEMEARRKHFELEGWHPEDIRAMDQVAAQYIRNRVEVHIGTIQLMRHARTRQEPLVSVPVRVRIGLEELIGIEATRELLK